MITINKGTKVLFLDSNDVEVIGIIKDINLDVVQVVDNNGHLHNVIVQLIIKTL